MSGFLSFTPCAFRFPQLIEFCVLLLYHSQGCHWTLSPVSSHRQSLNLWMVLGTPNKHALEVLCCAVLSHSVVSDSLRPHRLQPARLLCPWDSPDKNTRVCCHALLQGISPTQGSNPDLPHCRQILYCLSHQGSPKILEWEAYPFSRSSRPRNPTGVSCITGGFFTS